MGASPPCIPTSLACHWQATVVVVVAAVWAVAMQHTPCGSHQGLPKALPKAWAKAMALPSLFVSFRDTPGPVSMRPTIGHRCPMDLKGAPRLWSPCPIMHAMHIQPSPAPKVPPSTHPQQPPMSGPNDYQMGTGQMGSKAKWPDLHKGPTASCTWPRQCTAGPSARSRTPIAMVEGQPEMIQQRCDQWTSQATTPASHPHSPLPSTACLCTTQPCPPCTHASGTIHLPPAPTLAVGLHGHGTHTIQHMKGTHHLSTPPPPLPALSITGSPAPCTAPPSPPMPLTPAYSHPISVFRSHISHQGILTFALPSWTGGAASPPSSPSPPMLCTCLSSTILSHLNCLPSPSTGLTPHTLAHMHTRTHPHMRK